MNAIDHPGRARVWKQGGRWWYRAWSIYGFSMSHTCNYHGHEDGEESLARAADIARRQVAALDSLGARRD
jgi:hypothetical protein